MSRTEMQEETADGEHKGQQRNIYARIPVGSALHLLAKPELNGAHMRAGAAAALKSLQAERPKPVVLLLGDLEARRVSPKVSKSDVRFVSLKPCHESWSSQHFLICQG